MNPFDNHEQEQEIINRAIQIDNLAKHPNPEFSAAYQKKKEELMTEKGAGHEKSRPVRTAAMLTSILLLFCFLVACSPVRDFIVKIYEDFSRYFSSGTAYQIADLEIVLPDLPDDYELAEDTKQEFLSIKAYRLKGSDTDDLRIMIETSSEKSNNINNENMTIQELEIDGKSCVLSRHKEQNCATLWCDFDFAVVEIYSTYFSDDELIQFVKNIKIKPK